MAKPLTPGTVVVTNYMDLNSKNSLGIFVVLYDEQFDSNNIEKRNFIGLKITSSNSMCNNYAVPLIAKDIPFLDKDSFVLCSKRNILEKKNVCNILGVLPFEYYKKVFKLYHKYESEINRQMEDAF